MQIKFLKANRRIRLFLFLVLLGTPNYLFAHHQTENNLHIAYEHYLNFQLDSCNYYLERSSSSDPFTFYLNILLTSTKLLIDDNLDHFKENKFIENDLLDKLGEYNFTEDYFTFLKSEIKLQWALLKLKNGEELSAFWSLKQAYNLAEKNVEKYPEFTPSYKTIGLLHVLYGLFPDKYNWILTLFGITGNVSSGLSELEKVTNSQQILSLESTLILGLLHAYLLNDPGQAVMKIKPIYDQNEQLLITYMYALSLMKNRQSEHALNIITRAQHRYAQPLALPHLYYVKGEIFLQKGDPGKAIENYNIFLNTQKGKNLIKDTYYKIGICYHIMNKQDESLNYFEKSRLNGWAKNEADKYAKYAIESGSISDKQLYQLRYATDGGYYKTAFIIYQGIDTLKLNDHDRCEYYYRSARMFHASGNIQSAITNYQKTIKLQRDNNWYFAPNSALQLGIIYSSENERELANKYLQVVNNYKEYPYENSIRQKTKVALKEVD